MRYQLTVVVRGQDPHGIVTGLQYIPYHKVTPVPFHSPFGFGPEKG